MGWKLCLVFCFVLCCECAEQSTSLVVPEDGFSDDLNGYTTWKGIAKDAAISTAGKGNTVTERGTKDVQLLNEDMDLVQPTDSTSKKHSPWILETGSEADGGTFVIGVKTTPSEATMQNNTTETAIFPNSDGSGDWDQEATPPTKPERPTIIPHSCLRTPCNSSDLKIHAKTIILAPEGSNITVACKVESKEQTEVHWYKMNGSSLLFKTGTKNQNVLNLEFSETQLSDSGLYTCAQQNAVSCCRSEIRLKVYTVPNYKKHLLIIGAVAIVFFVVCMSFSVWWNKKSLRKYAKQYERTQNGKKEDMLLA